MPAKKNSKGASKDASKDATKAEKTVNVRAMPEDILNGVYSTLTVIQHTRHEFSLMFILQIGDEARVVSRVFVSPRHAKALCKALGDNIVKYEKKFGEIDTTE